MRLSIKSEASQNFFYLFDVEIRRGVALLKSQRCICFCESHRRCHYLKPRGAIVAIYAAFLPFSNWGFIRLFSHLEVRRVLDIFNRSRLGILGKGPRFCFFKVVMFKLVYFGWTSFFQIGYTKRMKPLYWWYRYPKIVGIILIRSIKLLRLRLNRFSFLAFV